MAVRPATAVNPRVVIGGRVIPARQRTYTDGLNGETVWTYHARIGGLRPGASYDYKYQVDLVVNGHDHDYERSFPVRGFDNNAGDTSRGTVFLVLGGGGTSDPTDHYEVDSADGVREAKVFTKRNAPEGTDGSPTSDYTELETFTLIRPRSDRRRPA
jgi:hypothetical protein